MATSLRAELPKLLAGKGFEHFSTFVWVKFRFSESLFQRDGSLAKLSQKSLINVTVS
jgi:hypothetical protein